MSLRGVCFVTVSLLFRLVLSLSLNPGTRPLNEFSFSHATAAAPLSPQQVALHSGTWIKLICGASNQDIPHIHDLAHIYTLAGVDCIDISADEAVVRAAVEGINKALPRQDDPKRPYLMISVNDGEDLHFRKAQFDQRLCPVDCPRPCEKVCPALAIPPLTTSTMTLQHPMAAGVDESRCYGCGRCLTLCPLGLITATAHSVTPQTILHLLNDDHSSLINALEIHTNHGHLTQFTKLWQEIGETVLNRCQVLSISFPDMLDETRPYLESLQAVIEETCNFSQFQGVQLWQTDGRPMSGLVVLPLKHFLTLFNRWLLLLLYIIVVKGHWQGHGARLCGLSPSPPTLFIIPRTH